MCQYIQVGNIGVLVDVNQDAGNKRLRNQQDAICVGKLTVCVDNHKCRWLAIGTDAGQLQGV